MVSVLMPSAIRFIPDDVPIYIIKDLSVNGIRNNAAKLNSFEYEPVIISP